MKNPCKECIVTTMCKDPCDKLVNYVDKYFDDYHFYFYDPEDLCYFIRKSRNNNSVESMSLSGHIKDDPTTVFFFTIAIKDGEIINTKKEKQFTHTSYTSHRVLSKQKYMNKLYEKDIK